MTPTIQKRVNIKYNPNQPLLGIFPQGEMLLGEMDTMAQPLEIILG